MATQEEVAEHLDITRQWVMKLVRDGILPPSKGRGGHDIDLCRKSYINHLRGVKSGQTKERVSEDESPSPPDDGSKDYTMLLEMEKHRRAKRENDIADGLVAPLSMITDALQNAGSQIVANLKALPLEMKRANPKLTGHDVMVIKKSIARCCEAISEIQVDQNSDQ